MAAERVVTARPSALGRALDLLQAIPAWAWLASLVCVSAGVRFALALDYPAPWIFHDELLYAEYARSIVETGGLGARGVAISGEHPFVYPVLIAPAYALFDDWQRAYEAAKLINAVVMSLAAVPAYLLARRLVSAPLALLAAAFAVAIPGMAYTSALMTENAFYPILGFWALALVLALDRPTVLRQLAALALLVLAYLTRRQAVVLVPALVAAIFLVVVLDARVSRERPFGRAILRRALRFWPTGLALAGGALVFLVVQVVARGRSLTYAFLGDYTPVASTDFSARQVARWLLYHLGEFDVALGVLPFAAFILMTGLALSLRDPSRDARVFAAVAVPTVVCLFVQVAAFASSPYGQQIQERNIFYLAPFFLVALVAWVGRGLPRPWPAAGLAALVAGALPGLVPYSSFINERAYTNAFGLLPLLRIQERWVRPDELVQVIGLAAVAAAAVFLLVPRRAALVVPLLVLIYLAAANSPVKSKTTIASNDSRRGGGTAQLDWIDRAVGRDARVGAIWTGSGNYQTLWNNEFFNHSVGNVYNLPGPPDGLPQKHIAPDPATGFLADDLGERVHESYVLADSTLVIDGRPVATDPGVGLVVYRVRPPVRAVGVVTGRYPDTWSGPTLSYTRYACSGGALSMTLTSDPTLHPYPQTVVASVGGKEVARTVVPYPSAGKRFSVPLPSGTNVCRVDFTVSPTAVPARVLPRNFDQRELGIRFTRFAYAPATKQPPRAS